MDKNTILHAYTILSHGNFHMGKEWKLAAKLCIDGISICVKISWPVKMVIGNGVWAIMNVESPKMTRSVAIDGPRIFVLMKSESLAHLVAPTITKKKYSMLIHPSLGLGGQLWGRLSHCIPVQIQVTLCRWPPESRLPGGKSTW